jgi:hypothetical protein
VRTAAPSSRQHRYPAEILAQCVRLSSRFPLSDRGAEEWMFERGVVVSSETMRRWRHQFGPACATERRRRRPQPSEKWHLDEVLIQMNGNTFSLWRAVDADGLVGVLRTVRLLVLRLRAERERGGLSVGSCQYPPAPADFSQVPVMRIGVSPVGGMLRHGLACIFSMLVFGTESAKQRRGCQHRGKGGLNAMSMDLTQVACVPLGIHCHMGTQVRVASPQLVAAAHVQDDPAVGHLKDRGLAGADHLAPRTRA